MVRKIFTSQTKYIFTFGRAVYEYGLYFMKVRKKTLFDNKIMIQMIFHMEIKLKRSNFFGIE